MLSQRYKWNKSELKALRSSELHISLVEARFIEMASKLHTLDMDGYVALPLSGKEITFVLPCRTKLWPLING